jgi:hypothetical protein
VTFAEWLEAEGRGAMARVHRETHLSYPTLYKAKDGEPVAPTTAKLISDACRRIGRATRGSVSKKLLEKGTKPAQAETGT